MGLTGLELVDSSGQAIPPHHITIQVHASTITVYLIPRLLPLHMQLHGNKAIYIPDSASILSSAD